MADFTQDFFSIRRNFADGNTRVGTAGKLWYDSITNSIRISDGHSPGGVLVNGSGGSYTLPTATPSVVGGVQLGANIIATGASIDVLQPTRVSQLENDSNYLSSAVLSGYATQTYVTSQGYISSAALASGNANVIAANTAIQSISANVGAYQIWANANVSALGSNAGVQGASINRLDANLGTATTNISNLVTGANANLAAYLLGTVTTGPHVVVGNITLTGNIIPTSTNTYNLGALGAKWANVFIGPGSLYLTDTVTTNTVALTATNNVLFLNGASGLTNGNLYFNQNTIVTLTPNADIVVGNVASGQGNLIINRSVQSLTGGIFGNLSLSNSTIESSQLSTDIVIGNVSATGNLVINRVTNFRGNIFAANITSAGNVTAANITSTGNISAGNVTSTGNVTAKYFIGDATFLTNVAPTVQNYLFGNVASSVSPYYQAQSLNEWTGLLSTATVAVTVTGTAKGAGTLLAGFLTNVGHPNILALPAGSAQFNFETTKASGNAGYICYVELYKRTAAGVETLIATSDSTTESTQNSQLTQQLVPMFIATVTTFALTDRLLVKVYAYKSSGGGNPSITLTFSDNTNSGFQIGLYPPTVNNFVPYYGAVQDINLGSYQLNSGNLTVASNVQSITRGTVLITADGTFQAPNTVGILLQATGQTNNPARVYIDGVGSNNYAAVIGRHFNGNTASPTQLLAGNVISRFGATPYTSSGWPAISTTRIDMVAEENQTSTAQGSAIQLWITPTSGNVIQKQLTVNAAGVSTTANLSSANVSVSGTAKITYTPTSTVGTAIQTTGKDTQGGTGYFDFLKATNTTSGATNPNKTIRLNSVGGIEIINSAYSATLMSISDAGAMSVSGSYQVSGKQAVNGPAFRAYVDTNQTITSGSQQKVTFGTKNFDTNSNFASSRFTPTLEGYYQFNAVVRIGGTATTAECMLVLYKNGAEYARGTNEAGTEQGASFYAMMVSDIAYANGTTDYFEVYIQQTSGGDRTTTAGSAISHFSGCMIRGA